MPTVQCYVHRPAQYARKASMRAQSSANSKHKIIHWVRHGQTEMNVRLGASTTPSQGYDTRLTARGILQAQLAREQAKLLQPRPEVLLSSPLTRALHTAQLVFQGQACHTVVEPLCTERLWLSSDVGRLPEQLQKEFPDWDFSTLENIWWKSNGSGDLKHVQAESTDEFHVRMQLLQSCISQRAESVIAIVSHFSVLEHMTGRQMKNGEIWSCRWQDGCCIPELS